MSVVSFLSSSIGVLPNPGDWIAFHAKRSFRNLQTGCVISISERPSNDETYSVKVAVWRSAVFKNMKPYNFKDIFIIKRAASTKILPEEELKNDVDDVPMKRQKQTPMNQSAIAPEIYTWRQAYDGEVYKDVHKRNTVDRDVARDILFKEMRAKGDEVRIPVLLTSLREKMYKNIKRKQDNTEFGRELDPGPIALAEIVSGAEESRSSSAESNAFFPSSVKSAASSSQPVNNVNQRTSLEQALRNGSYPEVKQALKVEKLFFLSSIMLLFIEHHILFFC